MDISKLNVKKACGVPRRMSLVHPFSGETLIDEDGKTLDLFIYGIKSDVARNAVKDRDRKYGSVKKMTQEQQAQSGAEFLAALTQGFTENIEGESGPYKTGNTYEAAVRMYLEQDWIAEQVQAFSMNIGNYDPNA